MTTAPGTNEFTIKVATVNGTGSASANALLMKTFFRMGIPVVGKNYFPSNIQGLPTWYEVRVSQQGYLARSGRVDLVVAMNAETYQKDLADVAPGGFLALRLDLAAAQEPEARRYPDHRCAAGTDVQRALQHGALAHPDEEHRLRGRAGRAAGPRHGCDRGFAAEELRQQAAADRGQQDRDPAGLRLRQGALSGRPAVPGAHRGQDHRPHHDRRQHRDCAGLSLRRRDRGRVVSDYAVDLGDGCVQDLLRALPGRRGDRAKQLRDHPGRGRTGRDRHGASARTGTAHARLRRPAARAFR